MRILIVIPYFYPKTGGLEKYAYNIAKRLVAKGVIIDVLTSNISGKEYASEKIDEMTVFKVPITFKISNTPICSSLRKRMKEIINEKKPDIINGHMPVPYFSDIAARVANEFNIPFVLVYQNDLVKETPILNSVAKIYNKTVGKKTLQLSKRIVASSDYYAEQSPYLQPNKERIVIIPPGVDIIKYNPGLDDEYLRKKYEFEKEKIILFVGQLDKTHRHKGVDDLLKALSILHEKGNKLKLVIVGEGDYKDTYRSIARDLSLDEHVIFSGRVPEEDLPYYYRGAHITVLPPYLKSEGFGMVLTEANACGRPVIGTRIGGIPNVIKEGYTGLLAPPRNPSVLAETIEKILNDEDLATKLGENGRRWVEEKFTWDKSADDMQRVFKEVL